MSDTNDATGHNHEGHDMTLEDDLAPLAADLEDALADRDKATQRADEIKEQIRARLAESGPGTYAAHGITVKATNARTVDTAKVANDFPPESHPYLYELKPSTKLVRAHLDEEQIEDYLTDAATLRIGLDR